jgi:pentatricopeptide repeat protein
LRLLQEAREQGLKPSLQIHTSAISAAAALSDADLAYQLYQDALKDGVKADCRMLTALVAAFGSQHRWKQAVKVLLFMLRTGIHPSILTFRFRYDWLTWRSLNMARSACASLSTMLKMTPKL